MSNKHVNHQHGLTTMNATRPKSKLSKRKNKAKAKDRKAILLQALNDAVAAGRTPGSKPAKSGGAGATGGTQSSTKATGTKKTTTKKTEPKKTAVKKEEPSKAEQTSIEA